MPPRKRAAEARRQSSRSKAPERVAFAVPTPEAASELAELLLSEDRTDPVVVISTPQHLRVPYVDVPTVLRDLPDGVPVYILPTGAPSWSFSTKMPSMTQVYGGASRVYPTGTAWTVDPFLSPLRFAYSTEDGLSVANRIVQDARRFAGAPMDTSIGGSTPVWTSETASPEPEDEESDESVAALRAQVRDLTEELLEAHRELNRLRVARDRDEADRRRVRQDMRELRGASVTPEPEVRAFLDPEEQFRFEVYLEWVRRVPAASKADHPLQDYIVGPAFLDSLSEVDVDRSKVVSVVVEVATGLDKEIQGRDLHTLRSGSGGNAPTVTRADGATCWRVAVQRGTPSARRLHYWRIGGGVIELSRVAVHDDMRP